MRRVDSEGDSQSSRDRKRGGARPSPARQLHLRRLVLEGLESRTLLSTIPSPITVGQSFVGSGTTSNSANSSSPSVAVDPLDPQKLVAAWTTYDPGHLLDGSGGQVTTYVQGAYSTNGGASWNALPGAMAVDIQTDFSVAPVTSGRQPDFSTTNNATVAFGRDQTAYLLTETSSGTGGVLDLQKWNFAGATPTQDTFTSPAYSGLSAGNTINPIYRWQGAAPNDGVLTPTLAVDNNLASFTSGSSTQTDPYAGNVYVAWETNDAAPTGVTSYNPNLLKIMSSSDGGQNFTYQAYLQSGHNTGNTYDAPKIAISQGSGSVPGGQVTVVYDNAGPGEAAAPYFDIVETQSSDTGGTDYHADSGRNIPLNSLTTNSGVTSVPIAVNINGASDPQFTTLQNLTVTLSLSHPNLADTSAVLMSPGGTSITLWNNANPAATPPLTGTLSGANLGASTLTPYIGTTLDQTAFRSLSGDGAAPYTGHFRPFGNLGSFDGLNAGQLNGTWNLIITQYVAETITAPTPNPFLIGASLDFTSGLSDVTNGAQHTVTRSFLNSGTHTYSNGIQAVPALPGASIASDNTLGANSPHQGRLYVALTNDNYVAATGANTTSTFIQLYTSDNGGLSWTNAGIVNDDNGLTDGFSTGGYAQGNSGIGSTNPGLAFGGGEANVRPKLEPQVAVDPDTGTLVVSFLDTRNDASAVRVANYIAVSTDGGASFAPETYANASQTTTDAITGATVNLGPIPDNESSGGNNQEATLGFGQTQGLAVLDGKIIPVWSSNENAGSALRNVKVPLNIESAVLTFAAGPRVLSGTQGPVGQPGDVLNTSRAADGTPIANTIRITFDRAVDPASFLADGGTIGTSPLQVFYNNPGGSAVAAPVGLKVLTVTPGANDTVYTITFDPAGHTVGSYSYILRPLVKGMVPYQAVIGGTLTTVPGNFLDQNNNGTPGQNPGDNYSVPTGRNSLPLIVPGPHVSSTGVVGVNGTPSTGSDNLVNNDNANSIDVTFDRQMQVSSFTPAQILSVVGPTGRIDGPQAFPSTGTSRIYPYTGSYQFIPKSGTLSSTILISNTGLRVSSLTVQVGVTDPNNSSLALSLVAPDGTTVPLVAAGGASGANFTNTTFSDAPGANGLTSTIAQGAAPYSLTYQPASPLAALSGKVLDGTWMLKITDSTAAPTPLGRLNSWSLSVTPQVPEGPGTQLNSTLVIPNYSDNSFLISHLAVQLNISSTKDSDLQLNLISPKQADGSQVTVPLVASMKASGANFTNTTFDDNATIPIASGTAPYSLTYRPSSLLSALDGLSINGTWTLQVVNPNADGSVTTLNSWSLIATPRLTVTPVNPTNGGAAATTFKIGFPTQTLSGTYTAILSPNILSVSPNPANPSTGTPLDTNLNAGVDALRGTSTGVTSTVVYPATAVPVAIPYASASNGVLTSQINVPDNFAIQGDVGTTAGLTVSLNISYYYDPDLTVTLTAPDGKTITLFMSVGKGSNTANFTNTTLSDTITPTAPISAAGAPFFGTFNPMGPLAGFATDLGGNQAFSQGLWTLTINNAGQDPGSSIDAAHPPALQSWSLAFQKPQTSTGLGEPVADQASVSFRLFNIAPTDPLANDTWTAVGPAGTSNGLGGSGANLGGPVSVVALDPSDPSGNTAYIGASSGGVWKTTNFLTTSAAGPTYVPLTDFGSNYSINIGSIAVFGRNGDPTQSIVFAGTGDGQAATANSGNAVQGVGILRSMNGGASFTLLDSSMNVYPSAYPSVYPNGTAVPPNLIGTALPATLVGTPLPIDSPFRDHDFVGTTTYKMIVDPTALPGGGVIVYAALGGPNGGLWRSLDGGNDWTLLKAGTATDVLLDPYSASPSTGNLDILYAGFEGVGVFISTNRGASLTLMAGTAGVTNLIQNSEISPATPLTVNNVTSPNGGNGRIILAKPALTNNAAENELYQDWLYVAVENTGGTFNGLYVTKDRGENWTKASIPTLPTPGGTSLVTQALPVNYSGTTNQYDVTAAQTERSHNGNSAFSMTIDPSNPNIIYLGGTHDFQASGLIRVDLTGLYDANALVPFANNLNDGGKLTEDSTGRINVNTTSFPGPFYEGTTPGGGFFGNSDGFLNLRHDPSNPFDANSTLFVYNSSAFTNDGTGVVWTPLDESPLDGSANIHQLLTIIDPLTGLTRLIVADDQGVFSGVYNANGTLSTSGLGTAPTVTGSLNGNLQDEAIYFSAAQPSALAAQAAGALFYGSGIGMTDVRSAANLLSTGNLTWSVAGTTYGDVQGVIRSDNRGGTGIATDPTGGVSAASPNGNPAVYEFDIPSLGGDYTNFFRVNTNGSTTGLVLANFTAEWPTNGAQYNGVIELGNFSVNPINGSQALISSNLGNLYETTTTGGAWLQIGSGSSDFDGTYAPALAYGAPDPGAPNGIGNLDNFIYAGTVGGHIYMTRNGAGPWTNLSAGLDGSSVVEIYTNPNRGSHEAYAVTLQGVYYMADSTASGATWANITGSLAQIQHSPFGDPTLAQGALLAFANGQLGGFRSIVADYRYAIPTNTPLPAIAATGPAAGPAATASVAATLTVAGNAPTTLLDGNGAGDAGTVTFDVTLVNSSRAASPYSIAITAPDGERIVLASGTVAAGTAAGSTTQEVSLTVPFALKSASVTVNGQYSLAVNNPGGTSVTIKGWSLSLNAQSVTVNPVLYVSGYGGVFRSLDNGQTWTAFPNTAFDSAPADGGFLPNVDVTGLTLNLGAINPATGHAGQVTGDPEVLLASTLGRGDFAIRLAPDVFPTTIHFDATLPGSGGSDSGASNSDRITNVLTPFIDGNSEISNFGNTVTITLTDVSNGHVIGTGTTDPFGNFSIQLINDGSDPTFFQSSTTLNDKVVGIQATDSSAKGNVTNFAYTLLITPPGTPSTPILDPTPVVINGVSYFYDSGRSHTDNITDIEIPSPIPGNAQAFVAPVFNIGTVAPSPGLPTSSTLELFRATSPTGPFTLVTTLAATGGTAMLSDGGLQALAQAAVPNGGLNGTYYYQADEIDLAGNVSAKSGVLAVTVNTTIPTTLPTPTLDPASNSGLVKSQDVTNVTHPTFDITGLSPGGQGFLYRKFGSQPTILVGTASVGATRVTDGVGATADGVYLYRVVQQDIAGNFSNYSTSLTVTIDTTIPAAPTINLVAPDDSGLPLHPNVTNVRSPHFSGTAPFNAGTNFPVAILAVTNGDVAHGIVQATTFPAANGTYLAQIVGPIADGTYTLVARSQNLAGNFSYSAPLTITIKASGPKIIPTLSILPADDTGIKGDGVTADHSPRFTGKTDPGDTVKLYAIINGQLSGAQATTTASTINGSFTFSLPFNLTNGTTQLVAQATDIANNSGPLGAPLAVRIISVAGDYSGTGAAQLTVFDPAAEAYIVRGSSGAVRVDTTPGRDVPIQYDINGDGKTDPVAYRYNTAEYFGLLSNNSTIDQPFGPGGIGLPVSGYYGTTGTYIYGTYNPNTAVWTIALPQAGGEVVPFGIANMDIPVPAAYSGGGVAEIAYFRPASTVATDRDSFTVATSVVNNKVVASTRVSFTNTALARFGFVYKPGDVPAPADYDGVGRDEFAIYRPSTGQFFVLNTPNINAPSTWTIRTVSLNLPGGPNVNDVPVSEDYDGNGKVDFAVYRPSNSTFYLIHSSTGIQENIQFGAPGGEVAAAGPLLYRLTALKGSFATTGGFAKGSTSGTGVTINAIAGGGAVHSQSIVSASSSSTSSSSTVPSLVAVASPMVLSTTVPPAPAPAPAPSTPSTTPAAKYQVVVGALTARAFIPVVAPATKPVAAAEVNNGVAKAKKPAKALVVDSSPHAAETSPQAKAVKAATSPAKQLPAVALAMDKVVKARKGGHQG